MLVDGKVKTKVVANTAQGFEDLCNWILKQKVALECVHVCLESTGIYSEPVALYFSDRGIKVSLVNPSCIKHFGASELLRNKTASREYLMT